MAPEKALEEPPPLCLPFRFYFVLFVILGLPAQTPTTLFSDYDFDYSRDLIGLESHNICLL
jgi:hypothetical protein